MKLKLETTDKEKHILYRIFAVVLCICILIMAALSLTYIGIEYNLTRQSFLVTVFIISLILIPIGIAVTKYYH